MVTRIRKGAKPHLYIAEWIEFRQLNPATLAGRMGKGRTTVWRWVTEQHRLTLDKIWLIAEALDIDPAELHYPPPHRSLDAKIKNETEAVKAKAAEMLDVFLKRA